MVTGGRKTGARRGTRTVPIVAFQPSPRIPSGDQISPTPGIKQPPLPDEPGCSRAGKDKMVCGLSVEGKKYRKELFMPSAHLRGYRVKTAPCYTEYSPFLSNSLALLHDNLMQQRGMGFTGTRWPTEAQGSGEANPTVQRKVPKPETDPGRHSAPTEGLHSSAQRGEGSHPTAHAEIG